MKTDKNPLEEDLQVASAAYTDKLPVLRKREINAQKIEPDIKPKRFMSFGDR